MPLTEFFKQTGNYDGFNVGQDLVDCYQDALRGGQSDLIPIFFGCRPKFTDLQDILPRNESTSKSDPILILSAGDRWNYKKNQAFWAGIIDQNRPLILVSDIQDSESGSQIIVGYTGDEMMWLSDNKYTFEPYPDYPEFTIAIPPKEPNPKHLRRVWDYTNIRNVARVKFETKGVSSLDELNKIKNTRKGLHDEREQAVVDALNRSLVLREYKRLSSNYPQHQPVTINQWQSKIPPPQAPKRLKTIDQKTQRKFPRDKILKSFSLDEIVKTGKQSILLEGNEVLIAIRQLMGSKMPTRSEKVSEKTFFQFLTNQANIPSESYFSSTSIPTGSHTPNLTTVVSPNPSIVINQPVTQETVDLSDKATKNLRNLKGLPKSSNS